MIARADLVTEINAAWIGLTIDERLHVSQRGARMTRLYMALDALAAASPYTINLDAID